MLQHKDPFLKTVADACWILSGWHNVYGNNNSRLSEANDGVAFETTDTAKDTKSNEKKHITCYKCKKTSHYSNDCEDDDKTVKMSKKKGSNFLVLNMDQDSSDDKADLTISYKHLVAIQEDEKEE